MKTKLSERDAKSEKAFYRAQDKADKTGKKQWFSGVFGSGGWWVHPRRENNRSKRHEKG